MKAQTPPDLSRLTPPQRRHYERGLLEIEKKIARYRLAEIQRLARPRVFPIVKGSPQPHALEAVKPGARPTPRRTGKPVVHVTFVSIFA